LVRFAHTTYDTNRAKGMANDSTVTGTAAGDSTSSALIAARSDECAAKSKASSSTVPRANCQRSGGRTAGTEPPLEV
jgi:hypothetical protein